MNGCSNQKTMPKIQSFECSDCGSKNIESVGEKWECLDCGGEGSIHAD